MVRLTLAMFWGLSLITTGCGSRAGGVDIWDAVEHGDSAGIKAFAAAGGDLDVRNWGGSTPLWVALTEKNRDSYEALLKYGADPNVIMSGKRVVTHWAATEQDSWWLRLALEHGADPNLVNVGSGQPSEGTPLHFAISKASLGKFDFLENIKLLVKYGADVDKPDRYNCYPLALAVEQNDFKIVLYLLDVGADFRRAQCSGKTFLNWFRERAEWREREEFMFQLKENRESFDAVHAWLKEHGVEVGGN